MSATVTDFAPKLRESTQAEIGKLRGVAQAEFEMSQELRDYAAKFTELAEEHYMRHVAAATKADDISLRLRLES